MKQYDASNIRNIAVVGHGGSGKTSLVEGLLYRTAGTDRLGKVTDGTTVSDYDAEEIKRKSSLNLSVVPVEYDQTKINLLDAPGLFDFALGQTEAIRAAGDTGLVVGMGAMSASSGNELSSTQQIRRCLEQLVDRFRETCYFGVLEKGQVFYLEKVESPNPLRMLTSTGHRLPAYATGLGKALLLDKTESEIRKLYPEGLRPLTENTVADIPSLMKQLEEAKVGGYTWEVQESTEHIRCFGVPVRIRGKIEGAISIAIPLFRYDPAEKEALVQALQESAKILEMILQKTGIDR